MQRSKRRGNLKSDSEKGGGGFTPRIKRGRFGGEKDVAENHLANSDERKEKYLEEPIKRKARKSKKAQGEKNIGRFRCENHQEAGPSSEETRGGGDRQRKG